MSKQTIATPHTHTPAAHRSKPLQAHVDDSYLLRGKPAAPAACTDCGAVFAHGRWSWAARPQDASSLICPACRRIRDAQPAGYLLIGFPYFSCRLWRLAGIPLNHAAFRLPYRAGRDSP